MSSEPVRFELEGASGRKLAGVGEGEGPAIVLAHGLTAHRDLVVHGSRVLPRKGYRLLRYDARGHGESEGTGPGTYSYETLAEDLGRVLDEQADADAGLVAAGHSMGAHTIVRYALEHPDRFDALVLIGPVTTGSPIGPRAEAYWDSLADGVREDGVEGFLRALDADLDPEWRDLILRIAEQRMRKHEDLGAIADALAELPGSQPLGSLDELAALELPVLVVASHDDADPGHPYATAEAYAGALPDAELISEEAGESPLAWQGGKLSREIAAFCERVGVSGRG